MKGFQCIITRGKLLRNRSAEKIIERNTVRQHSVVLLRATTLNSVQFLFGQELSVLVFDNLVEAALGAFLLFRALLLVKEEG